MITRIAGVGVWARGFTGLQDVIDRWADATTAEAAYSPPAPEAIPSRERRRAGPYISLAVEVAHQACDMAGVDKTTIPSVFASCMGDTDITDYLCRKLTQTEKLLSPTAFHNSVHNAASGYWTISTGNRSPSTFVGGFERSFGAGLIEAVSQAIAFGRPVLLACYDTATRVPFRDILAIDEPMGVAFVLAPAHGHSSPEALALDLEVTVKVGSSDSATEVGAGLSHLMCGSSMADAVAMLDAIARFGRGTQQTYEADVRLPGRAALEVRLRRSDRVAS